MGENKRSHAEAEEAAACVAGEEADPQRREDDPREEREQEERAEIPRLLGVDAEDEVVHGDGGRQVFEVVRLTLADPLARQPAGANRDLGLTQVVARPQLILVGEEKDLHAPDLVILKRQELQDRLAPLRGNARLLRLVDGAQNRQREERANRHQRQKPTPENARAQHDDEDGRGERQGRPQIGFEQDENARHTREEDGQEKCPHPQRPRLVP